MSKSVFISFKKYITCTVPLLCLAQHKVGKMAHIYIQCSIHINQRNAARVRKDLPEVSWSLLVSTLEIRLLLFLKSVSSHAAYAAWLRLLWEYLPHEKWQMRASLVAQWLRVCLPIQGTRIRALVWEDPTCRGATGPVSHNYWAWASGACAPQQERPR